MPLPPPPTMPPIPGSNTLYLVVLPIIHLGTGATEQTLTLLPNRDLATEFFEDEVDSYVLMFKNRADKYLTGGHVTGYKVDPEKIGNRRVIVRVIQNVS